MKQIEIKIHNDNQTISSQKINIQSHQPIILNATSKVNYELVDTSNGFAPDHIVTKRNSDDLYILFDSNEEGTLVLKGFYNTEHSAIIGLSELGNYHYYTPDTGDIKDYVTLLTASNQVSGHALGSRELEYAWWVDVNTAQSSEPAQTSFDDSHNTGYVLNTGDGLVLVDTPSIAITPTTLPKPTTIKMTDNDVITESIGTKSIDKASIHKISTDIINHDTTIETAPTAEGISASDWTPWAVAGASVVGIGLALSSQLKGVNEEPKDTTASNM